MGFVVNFRLDRDQLVYDQVKLCIFLEDNPVGKASLTKSHNAAIFNLFTFVILSTDQTHALYVFKLAK